VLGPSSACDTSLPLITGCEAGAGLEPICGLMNPEDFAVLPGGDWLAVSQMASPAHHGGSLAALRVADDSFIRLYPDGELAATDDGPNAGVSAPGWGDPACPGPPDPERFAPHGIDTASATGGAALLLVINHGDREAVELFEVDTSMARPSVTWRGCVLTPSDASGNDVAATSDGRFVMSNMARPQGALRSWWSGLRMAMGLDTGNVLEWSPESGWSDVEGSEASGPNGVAIDADGSTVYIAGYGSRELIRVRRANGPEVRTVDVPFRPDNITWTPEGSLLVAGQDAPLRQILACYALGSGTCALPFGVVEVDPDTLATDILLEHDGRVAIGTAIVALRHRDKLYLGTFRGNRAARSEANVH
jgi:hypothetical protein